MKREFEKNFIGATKPPARFQRFDAEVLALAELKVSFVHPELKK